MKTRPLWAMLSGPASIELDRRDREILGAKFAYITLPVGKNTLVIPATREVADAVQKLLSLEIVDYAE